MRNEPSLNNRPLKALDVTIGLDKQVPPTTRTITDPKEVAYLIPPHFDPMPQANMIPVELDDGTKGRVHEFEWQLFTNPSENLPNGSCLLRGDCVAGNLNIISVTHLVEIAGGNRAVIGLDDSEVLSHCIDWTDEKIIAHSIHPHLNMTIAALFIPDMNCPESNGRHVNLNQVGTLSGASWGALDTDNRHLADWISLLSTSLSLRSAWTERQTGGDSIGDVLGRMSVKGAAYHKARLKLVK